MLKKNSFCILLCVFSISFFSGCSETNSQETHSDSDNLNDYFSEEIVSYENEMEYFFSSEYEVVNQNNNDNTISPTLANIIRRNETADYILSNIKIVERDVDIVIIDDEIPLSERIFFGEGDMFSFEYNMNWYYNVFFDYQIFAGIPSHFIRVVEDDKGWDWFDQFPTLGGERDEREFNLITFVNEVGITPEKMVLVQEEIFGRPMSEIDTLVTWVRNADFETLTDDEKNVYIFWQYRLSLSEIEALFSNDIYVIWDSFPGHGILYNGRAYSPEWIIQNMYEAIWEHKLPFNEISRVLERVSNFPVLYEAFDLALEIFNTESIVNDVRILEKEGIDEEMKITCEEIKTINLSSDYQIFDNIDEISSLATDVLRVEVLDARVDKIKTSLPFEAMPPELQALVNRDNLEQLYRVVTIYDLRILDVFKGDLNKNEIINVAISGGQFEDMNIKHSSHNHLNLGDDLLLLLQESHVEGSSLFFPVSVSQAIYRFYQHSPNILTRGLEIEFENIHEHSGYGLTFTLSDLAKIAEVNALKGRYSILFSEITEKSYYYDDDLKNEENVSEEDTTIPDNYDLESLPKDSNN